jgi:hypothetical protein
MWISEAARYLHLSAPFFAALIFRTDALALLLAFLTCILYTIYSLPWEDPEKSIVAGAKWSRINAPMSDG